LLAVAVTTASGEGRVEIWNTDTWKEEFVLTAGPYDKFSGLAFSPDVTLLAVAQENGLATLWSLQSRSETEALVGPAAPITSMVFNPNGSRLATAYGDGEARIWRATGPELYDLRLGGSIASVALSANRLAVASLDKGEVQVSDWQVSGQEISPIHSFLIPGSSPADLVTVSPDGRYVADVKAAACPSGLCPTVRLRVFSVATGSSRGPPYPVLGAEAVSWSADDQEIAVASINLQLLVLATQSVASVGVTGAEQCGVDGAPAFSANDSLVAWATRCGNVAVFRVNNGVPAAQPVASFSAQGEPSAVAFNPAGTQLAVSSWSGAVGVWNPHTGKQELSLATATSGVSYVTYSPDGRYLFTTVLDGTAQAWSATSLQLQRVDEDSTSSPVAPAFDAVGGEFATGDADGTVRIWAECPACDDASSLVRLAKAQAAAAGK
jgi:WD40 repeat protein